MAERKMLMTYTEFYGSNYTGMKQAEQYLLDLIDQYTVVKREREGMKPIVYRCSRIKTPESMIQKLKKRGYEPTVADALSKVHDAIGVRAVCAFSEDVYRFVHWLKTQNTIEILSEKDYYTHPKPNGYRSYHMQILLKNETISEYYAEIQIRTIATDFWATLEHQLKYKEDIPNEKLIRSELKRCADEIASTDLSMQTIRDIIRESLTQQ